MLPWCIALSAAVHVLLLTAAAPASPRLGGLARQAARRVPGPISVRLIAEDAAPQGSAASAAAWPASAASDALPRPDVVATTAASAAASAPESLAAVPVPGADELATSAAGDASGDGYVPRPLLSVAPVATAPVVIASPPGKAELGRRVGVLALYIDEQGRVRRIEAEQPLLPEAMERAAREAFIDARFRPGQVDGHVVKSRIRVEVVFDEGPAPATSAASAASGASASASVGVVKPAGVQRSP